MDKDTLDALIGQLAADATFNQALVIALMELHPTLRAAIEAKVAATAPATRLALPQPQVAAFDQRLREVLSLMRNA